ncbi:MAG: glycosyltransferase family 2 protein [Bacteroidales bacterium]|nr:glycosyltransferase family 2 protein [Bacteroidales bacterium]
MKWIDRCLGSLRESSLPVDVMVIDNCSVDGSPEYIKAHYPEVMVHCAAQNLGFGRANNVGLQKASEEGYDYVYLLNQDAWVGPDTFESLTSAMQRHPQYGILSPMQLTTTRDKLDPRFANWCPDKAVQEWRSSSSGRIHDVKFVMAAHWMVSRECLKKVGGFSPAFTHYGEDDNYIHRAQYHGFSIGVLSDAFAVHDREMRPMSKPASMRMKCVASVVKISNPLNFLPFRMLFQPMELLAISVRYCSLSVFRYIFTLIRDYSRLRTLRRQSLRDGAFLESAE